MRMEKDLINICISFERRKKEAGCLLHITKDRIIKIYQGTMKFVSESEALVL